MNIAIKIYKQLIVLFILIPIVLKSQSQITLSYEEFGLQFFPKNAYDTLIKKKIKDYEGYSLKLFLHNYNGEATIVLLDKKGRIRVKGNYIGGKDTLLKYSLNQGLGYENGISHTSVSVIKFLYPLKNGSWYYYDESHKIIRKEEYENEFH